MNNVTWTWVWKCILVFAFNSFEYKVFWASAVAISYLSIMIEHINVYLIIWTWQVDKLLAFIFLKVNWGSERLKWGIRFKNWFSNHNFKIPSTTKQTVWGQQQCLSCLGLAWTRCSGSVWRMKTTFCILLGNSTSAAWILNETYLLTCWKTWVGLEEPWKASEGDHWLHVWRMGIEVIMLRWEMLLTHRSAPEGKLGHSGMSTLTSCLLPYSSSWLNHRFFPLWSLSWTWIMAQEGKGNLKSLICCGRKYNMFL